jgi:hypothetical protein
MHVAELHVSGSGVSTFQFNDTMMKFSSTSQKLQLSWGSWGFSTSNVCTVPFENPMSIFGHQGGI